jgi:hypothetical protein
MSKEFTVLTKFIRNVTPHICDDDTPVEEFAKTQLRYFDRALYPALKDEVTKILGVGYDDLHLIAFWHKNNNAMSFASRRGTRLFLTSVLHHLQNS